ncbi:MAG TPA: hypothetical protein VL147_06080 [Devosia sp.]|nr:hypothetical protein [Devosia sp.]
MSQAPSNYDRVAGDKYFTPAWVSSALFAVEPFHGGLWDPAGGDGQIVLAAQAAGMLAFGSDIEPDADFIKPGDFFEVKAGAIWPNIVSNPPYGVQSRLAVQFIEHSLALTAPRGGKVAMLLKVGFDSAPGRRRLFADHPAFAAEYRITKRILWSNLPPKFDAKGKLMGPTEHHSWFVWDWRLRGGPAVKGYLPGAVRQKAGPEE